MVVTWPGWACVAECIWHGSDNHSYKLSKLIHCIVRPNSCNAYTVSWLVVVTQPGWACVAKSIWPSSDNHSDELLGLIPLRHSAFLICVLAVLPYVLKLTRRMPQYTEFIKYVPAWRVIYCTVSILVVMYIRCRPSRMTEHSPEPIRPIQCIPA